MKKSAAHIILALLLLLPFSSLVSALLSTDAQKVRQTSELASPFDIDFPGDPDDSVPSQDNEGDKDDEAMMFEKWTMHPVIPRLKQRESRQSHLFKEHHCEVNTPPPRI